ncbi:MAG: adenylate cyclase [Deltaproteobacteria bacterium]|nr:MAG: adenylate cyclase [Deltaproteobacteria bacterium]
MNTEIERKFLVDTALLPKLSGGTEIRQAYLSLDPTVRLRIKGDRAYITVKSKGLVERKEIQVEIPIAECEAMMELCPESTIIIEKERFEVKHKGNLWVVDFFHGAHEGLVIAEIELDKINQDVEIPPWAHREVTGDPSYLNSNLALSGAKQGE